VRAIKIEGRLKPATGKRTGVGVELTVEVGRRAYKVFVG